MDSMGTGSIVSVAGSLLGYDSNDECDKMPADSCIAPSCVWYVRFIFKVCNSVGMQDGRG